MLSQWRTNMTKVWYSFLQDGDVNDFQGHRCKICVQSHVYPACSVSVLLTSNVHTDCKTVKTTLQDSDIHRAEGIIIPSKSRDQI